mmetsp:Transcript_22092/g.58322  ORF Transcript_22092/g.58322 Transcript_22092/m.58322 type:complete len:268 (-) Transcript_22092:78-881(-)
MKFRPCIDIHNGVVKQIVGGTLKDDDKEDLVTNFSATQPSSYFAERYREDGLLGGHVVMLGATPESKAAALAALRAYPNGLQVGGGVTVDNAQEYLDAGASHVIVTSHVFYGGTLDRERLVALVAKVGKERLVLDLSCRRVAGADGAAPTYKVVTDRWQKWTDLEVCPATLEELAKHCVEFLVHGVDVEGLQGGIEDPLVEILAGSPIPVTYAGGVRSLEDMERIRALGGGKVDATIGSALDMFGGPLPYADVLAWHHKQQESAAPE